MTKECKLKEEKHKLDNIYSQLDEYYFELKNRMITLINTNLFEKDVEFFLIKMLKLDDKESSSFNLIDFIVQLKQFNDKLFSSHKQNCSNDSVDTIPLLLERIEKLNSKIKQLEENNETYKKRLDKLESNIHKNEVKFENVNINYNSTPYHNTDRLLINDLNSLVLCNSNRNNNLKTSKSNKIIKLTINSKNDNKNKPISRTDSNFKPNQDFGFINKRIFDQLYLSKCSTAKTNYSRDTTNKRVERKQIDLSCSSKTNHNMSTLLSKTYLTKTKATSIPKKNDSHMKPKHSFLNLSINGTKK